MSIEKSEAVVLKAFNWSESSRTVSFFTVSYGRLALIDKGGRSIKSRRGRIMPFARMEITFYHSEKESRGYVRDVELLELFSLEADGGIGRLAYGSAAAELLNLLLPEEEPQTQLYSYFVKFLHHIERADKKSLPALFVAFYLRVLSQLGYHPSLAFCVSCGKDLKEFGEGQPRQIGVERGGVVCEACQRPGDYYIGFSDKSFRALLSLQTASLDEAASRVIGFKEAGRIMEMLTKFMGSQTGFKSELKSLEFIDKLKNSQLTG